MLAASRALTKTDGLVDFSRSIILSILVRVLRLVSGASCGDHLFFHYSGRGSLAEGDEMSGLLSM